MTRALAGLLISGIAFMASSSTALAQLNPLTAIAKFESSYGTDVGSPPGSTASGIFQDVNGTFAQGLRLAGLNPADFPTAAQAPASVQFAANAALYNSRGFADWLCPGCDAKLTQYVAQQGGTGAFAHPGTLSTDPAFWAAQGVDSPAGLQAYFQANGGTDAGLASNDPSSLTQSPFSPPHAAASPSAMPFTLIFNELMTGVLPRVDGMLAQGLAAVWPFFLGAAALAVAIKGLLAMRGELAMDDLIEFALRVAIVAGFMAPDGSYFERWIEKPLLGLPGWFATLFSGNSAVNIASPAGFFDSLYNGLWATSHSVWHSSPWAFSTIYTAISLVLTTYLGIGALILLFLAFLLGNFLVFILLIIAPFVFPALLFRATTTYFTGWVHAVVTALLTALLVNVVLGLYFVLTQTLVAGFQPSGSPTTDLGSYAGLVVGLLIMGLTIVFVPRLAHSIGHGVSVSTEAAARHAGGLNIAQHASSAGRFLGALHG